MAKTKISEFSTTPGNNTDINGINIAEGCAPSGINNAIRELMSDLKEWQSGAMDVYVIPQGTAAAPGIQLYGDLDTGLYGYAANQLGVAVGGASAGYFSSAGWVGNVNGTITGDINATTIDTTNLEVTNIKAKDGTAAITIADSTGAVGVSTAVTLSATTQNIALGTSQTTGTYTVGGTAQTGTQSIGRSTKTHTFNVATGATESGATKTVNIATAGVSGSTTTISIGSSVSGATSTTTLSGNVTATRDMTVNGVTVGKGKGSEGSNTALGLSALAAFSAGESSTALGQYALWKATTSAFNTAVGAQSQLNSLTGGYNTSVGALTLNTATAGSSNVAIGFSALNLATGDNNTAVGSGAGSLITTGAKNTIIGNYSGNQGGLDITTSSNYIVLSDGDGNPRAYWNGANATLGGTLNATTITGTQVNSDNLRLDGNTISSTDTNGNIVIAPNGTGQVQLSGALDVTNIEVTNIKAKDGTAALSIADSTGAVTVATALTANGGAVFNENGADVDFRVEGDTDANLIFADASTDRVGIGVNPPAAKFHVESAGPIQSLLRTTGSTSYTSLRLYNDQGSSARSLEIDYSGSAYSGALLLNGPSGEQAAIATTGAYPLTLGTANTARAVITSGGQVNIGGNFTSTNNTLQVTGNAAVGYTAAAPANGLIVAGNVGIGTSSPDAKLRIQNDNSTIPSLIIRDGGTPAANMIQVSSNATGDALILNASGNLGLGVTPSAWGTAAQNAFQQAQGAALSSRGAGNTETTVTHGAFYDGTNWKYTATSVGAARYQMVGANAGSSHSWSVSAGGTAGNAISFTQAMTLDASGQLGIGSTSPTQVLTIAQDGNFPFIHWNNSSNTNIAFAGWHGGTGGGDDFRIGTTGAKAFTFRTDNTERARITSGGDFLIGKQATDTAVVGVQLLSNGTVTSTRSGSTNATSTMEVYSTGASAYRFYVLMDGTVNATNTTITAISDQRLKENIQDIDVGLNAIMALKPRKFDWKEGKGKDKKGDRGWIAQEFEQVFPDMISEWKDPAPEGEEPYKAVNADLIPVLVKAIQEQQAMINELKAEVAALKGV